MVFVVDGLEKFIFTIGTIAVPLSYTDYVLLRLFTGARVNVVHKRWTIFILYRHYTINYWTILQILLVLIRTYRNRGLWGFGLA